MSTDLTIGISNTITITPEWIGYEAQEGYAVWIDYNQDNDFDYLEERVWYQGYGWAPPVGSFTVPPSALTGNTRMRVSMKFGNPYPCESI